MAFRLLSTSLAMFASSLVASAQLPVIRLYALSPAGGKSGTTFDVMVSGADLDELTALRFSDTNITARPKIGAETGLAEPNKFLVTIASNALPGSCEVRAVGRFGISNSRAFTIGVYNELVEGADNHATTSPMEVAVGTTVNAQADANAFDYFRFPATKGQRILIECRARVIDSRMEPLMVLYDSAGRELDRARNRELINFVAPENGTNVLKVSDLLYRGGSEYFYRLTLHSGPRIEFILPPSAVAGTTNKHTIYGWNLPGGTPATNIAMRD